MVFGGEMAFNLSTVVAYMCGAEVQELQSSFFALDLAGNTTRADPTSDAHPSAVFFGENKEKNSADQSIGTPPAATNKPLRSAEWMVSARRAFTTSGLSRKDSIVASPPLPQKKNNAATLRSANTASTNMTSHNSSSLSTSLVSRGGLSPLSDVVAQTLPCLGCSTTSTVGTPTLLPRQQRPSLSGEGLRWGVPRWPDCTITFHTSQNLVQEGGKVAPDAAMGDAQESAVAESTSIRWSSEGCTPNGRLSGVNVGTTLMTNTAAALADLEGSRKNADPFCGEASSRLVVCMLCNRECLESAAPSLGASFSEKGIAVFCDPVVSTPSPLPSRVPSPTSLLLPDVVCLRDLPAHWPKTPSTYHLSSATEATPTTTAATSGTDGPTVEMLLVAVEALPELFETRRQGLLLYKEVLLRYYGTKKADGVMRGQEESNTDELSFSASRALPELPSLQWRCELWTPPPEGKAGKSPEVPMTTAENLKDDVVCRTVVQAGFFSMYSPNKSTTTPPSASLSPSAYPAMVAATESRLFSMRMRFMDLDEVPPHATRVPSPSPSPRTPLGDLEFNLRTFCRWWADMEQLARQLVPPAPLSFSIDFPISSAPELSAFTEITTSASVTRVSQSSTVETGANAVGMHATVEQLLWWWAAKAVRVVSAASLHRLPLCLLPPLPTGATPLFGAIIIPAYVRTTSASLAVAAAAASSTGEEGGAQSLPAMSLPSLTLCFVNPRGAYVHQYDIEALNVLCRAVHALHAVVCVYDAAQKAALLAFMRGFVRPYASPPPLPLASTTATIATLDPVSFADSVPSMRSSSTASAVHCVNLGSFSGNSATTTINIAAATTTATIASPATPTGAPYLEYAYDAITEVEKNCLCLEDYVYERRRRALTDHKMDEKDSETKGESKDTATPSGTKKQQQQQLQAGLPLFASCGIEERARTGAAPSRAWCHDARVLAPADFIGRGRLDVLTSPLKRTPPSTLIPGSSTANPTTPASIGKIISEEQQQQVPPLPPPLALNPVPPSFLAYLLTRVGDNGLEELEKLSGTIMQMGRRLSGV